MNSPPLRTATQPTVTKALLDEHRVIEIVLGVLDKLADRAFAKGEVDVAAARESILFLREFADRCHHGKEEQRLFPAMESCGLPSEVGPTAVMRAEHEMGRAHVRGMDAAVAAFEKGAPGASDKFAFEARGFADLLRDHIAKEDQVLFPMAERMLPPHVRDALLADYAAFESAELPAGTHERFEALAASLGARFGVTPESAKACSHVCGCHGSDAE